MAELCRHEQEVIVAIKVMILDLIRKMSPVRDGDQREKLEEQKVRAAILEVGVRNHPAQQLYEKLQYQYLATLFGYYHGREDAYRMVRLLSPRKPGEYH